MQLAAVSPTGHALESFQREPWHFGKCLRALCFLARGAARGEAREVAGAFARACAVADGPADLLVDFAGRVPTRTYDRGAPIYQEGERDDALCVLLSGEVALRRATVGELRRLSYAGLFGAVSALYGVDRTESAVALSPCEVAILPKAPLWALAERMSSVGRCVRAVAEEGLLHDLFPAGSPFGGLDDELKRTLLHRCGARTVERGTHLLRQEHKPAACVSILSGRAQTWRTTADAAREIGSPLGPGDLFGARAVLRDRPAGYHVLTSSRVTLFGIRPEDVCALAEQSATVRRALLASGPLFDQ